MQVKKYPLLTITKLEEDILYIEYEHNLKADIEAAKELVSNRMDFSNGENCYLISDVSSAKGVTREAKEYLQDPEAGLKHILGSAFIASNPLAVLIANIFIKSRKNHAPSKCFSNKADALKWIKDVKNKKI